MNNRNHPTLLALSLTAAIAITLVVVPAVCVVAQTASIDDLRANGTFGFPAGSARTHCDTTDLRVQSWNDEENLVVQAIVWKDGSAELGETSDGRVIGDTTFYMEFPELGKTWKGLPARAGVYIPDDYTSDRTFPLFVWFGGGSGSDNPKKAVAITGGSGFVCVAVPYRSEDDGKNGGWQTPWSYYKTIFDKLETIVPNIDSRRRVCGGFSSGGAAIMYQIGNSEEAFQKYFYAFMPGGAGWPMGGLSSIKGRPMLALMGENDKRLPNYQKLAEEARAAGIDIKFRLFKDCGHAMPEKHHPEIREWIVKNVLLRNVASPSKANYIHPVK